MPQSLSKVSVHLVFSTKGRREFLVDLELRDRLYGYMAAVMRDRLESPALLINGTADHVHVLFVLSRKHAIMQVVGDLKKESTKWVKKQSIADFTWQAGYGIFAVSESNLARVRAYVANQEKHHATLSFQDEFRAFCEKHKVGLDERYAWD